jgi:hypothetical protein
MINSIKRFVASCGLVFFLIAAPCSGRVKPAHEAFGYLVKKQQIFDTLPITKIADDIEGHVHFVFEKYKNEKSYTSVLETLLKSFGYTGDFSNPQAIVLPENVKTKLKQFYSDLDHNVPEFIETLKMLGFANAAINEQEEKMYESGNSKDLVDRYKIFMHLLLAQKDEIKELEYFFTVGRNFFNYCYGETGPQFVELLKDKANHSIGRLLYSVLWWALSGTGWRYWQLQTLKALKEEVDKGKEVIYIAGGNDLYHMVKRGIYNITIVDPELPTQPKYYTRDWEWLVKGIGDDGGLGDEIIFFLRDEKKKIIMRRAYFKEGDSFVSRLAEGEQITIRKSVTKWEIYEEPLTAEAYCYSTLDGKPAVAPVAQVEESGIGAFFKKVWNNVTSFFRRPLGVITFDRRLVKQDDFTDAPNKVVLMSFNEIFYIALKDWGVDPEKIDPKLHIQCKQLGYMLTKKDLVNVSEAFKTDFHFIRLGSCVN